MEDSPNKAPPSEVVVAETVFLLMTKEHRISKHLRAKWYLKHVNTVMDFPYTDENVGHPQLVSVLVNGGQSLRPAPDGQPVKFKLATDTTVNFLSTHHDIVFAIDVSFSTISSSTADSEVLFDKMYSSLEKCARGLTKTFIIPGSDGIEFVPYLYATVIAYSPLNNCPVQQVLTHGYLVSHYNVGEFISYINLEINRFENGVANYMNSLLMEPSYNPSEESSATASGGEDDESSPLHKLHLSPEKGFFHLLKNAMLAIHLLPTNCSSGIIVITDGSVGIGDVGRYDNLLVQLLSQSCTCSVIEVGCENSLKRGLGRVPHSEMLRFIATATFGAYFNETPCMKDDMSKKMNKYHEGILCWDFRKSIKDFLSIGPTSSYRLCRSLAYENKIRRRCTEYKLAVPINCVITTRLKEGFTIKTVDASKEVIEVVMVLPWRKNVCIEYKASSVWPVPATNPVTNVYTCFEGNYHFLHDLTCKKAHTQNNKATRYRQALVNRFWKSMLSLKPIDESLVMMQSFHTQDDFSTVPDSIKKGVALFYCINSQNGRSVDIINHSSDADVELFASYWRRVLCIDLGVPLDKSGLTFDRSSHIILPSGSTYPGLDREKWFHITRLYMVLEHDPKHPEMLNVPYSHDRYYSLQCRQAAQTLIKTLREWSDFELLENSHFVKYINRQDNDFTPISGYHAENWLSFCMIVLNIKGACVTLRLTYLGGTDSIYRTRLINELKEEIQGLHFQKRPEKSSHRPSRQTGDDNHIPPLQRKWEERQCCILMSKPLDRVLVRYERKPKKILTVDNINQDIAPVEGIPSRLANYLHHQRWVWYLQPDDDSVHFESLDIKSIGNILDVVTKLRLQEGFHFSQTNSGIVSMILEVDMTNVKEGVATQIPKEDQESLSCLVQYITFPPQRRARLQDGSDSEGEDDSVECGELVMVTEVWIEPQHGSVTNSTPERMHYDGCPFYEWPDKLFPVDQRCITLLVTLDHLLKYCTPPSRVSMSSSLVSGRQEKLDPNGCDESDNDTNRVKQVPFVFSVIELLAVCQQVETLFPTYCISQAAEAEDNVGRRTNDILFKHMMDDIDKHPNAYELELTSDECVKFLKQLQDRPRSRTAEPLPFKWTPGDDAALPGGALDSERDDGLTNSRPTTRNERHMRNTSDSPAPGLRKASNSSSTDDSPNLRCFCIPGNYDKHGSLDSVTLLFVPSSYSDLKLMCSNNMCDKATQAADCSATEDTLHAVPPIDVGNEEADKQSLPLPIYMYYCSRQAVIDTLVNPNIAYIKPDEYIDKRFAQLSDTNSSVEQATSHRSDRSDESDKLPSPTTNRRRYRTDSGCSRRSFSRAVSLDMSVQDASSYNLNTFCDDVFSKSFITGIFQSLQRGYDIASEDIEFAIDICMEAGIFEVELTSFLGYVCSHMNSAPLDTSCDQVFADAAASNTSKSVKFMDESSHEQSTAPKRSSGSSDSANRPSNLRSPVTLKVPCATLFEKKCETAVSAARIKEKFSEVIGRWFKPIPSCQDVFYYAPSHIRNELQWYSSDIDGLSSLDLKTESEDADQFESCEEETGKRRLYSHSLSELSKDSLAVEVDGVKPLFVHLTASIQNERVYQSVPNIPVCLCELEEGLQKKESIDIANASITLDLICLTLSNELSCNDPIIEEPEKSEENGDDRKSAAESHDDSEQDLKLAITAFQNSDVLECKKSIEWLVKDEIAAAMRTTTPITEETLKMVAEHVKSGQSEMSCKYAKERLDYVFGPELSHEMFIQDFEKMNVTGYQLIKCGDYYYLSLDRARLKSLRPTYPIDCQLKDVAFKLDHMNSVLDDCESHAGSSGADRSIEVLPHSARPSVASAGPASCAFGENSPSDGEWTINMTGSRRRGNSESTGSDFDLLDEDEDEETDKGRTIPMTGPYRSSTGFDFISSEGAAPVNRKALLNSLPQHSQIDSWSRDEDEFASKCGSLPKAFSSCNVNIDRSLSADRRALKRVCSGPQELHSADNAKPKVRHVSEDTGRRRATFADSVLSPPTSSASALMRDNLELEAARSRNTSGPWTPRSARINGSSGSESTSESDPGYEADFSDEEWTGGGPSLTGTDIGSRTAQMPNFWLIMQVHSDKGDDSAVNESPHRFTHAESAGDFRIDVYFHTSETVQMERHFSDSMKGNVPKHKLFNHVLNEIRRTCKLVNQRLLLRELHNKRKCDVLLEEDWDDELSTNDSRLGAKVNQTDSDGEGEHRSDDEYLFARTKFKQGHFKCDLKWEKTFQLHPRLKGSKGKMSINRGVAALRSGLNNLRITNRSNMFVHKESQTGNIFYLRLSECNEQGSTLRSDYGEEFRHFGGEPTAHLSRSSSIKSVGRTRDESDSSRRPSVNENDDAQSYTSSRASVVRRPVGDDGVKLYVYGIDDVGSDIKVDLVRMLEVRLDETVLVEIEMLLSRNPNCMLTPQDVHFLQRAELPTTTLKLSLPDEVLHHQTAVLHYLRQNLLLPDLLFHPKYQDTNHKFMDYTESADSDITMQDSNTFLHNKSPSYHNAEKGAGLALIYLQLVDSLDRPKHLLHCPKPDVDAWEKLPSSSFEKLTTVTKAETEEKNKAVTTSSFIRFSIWLRGDVDLKVLENLLKTSLVHSLCDFVCEYFAFTAPLCLPPPDLLHELATVRAQEENSFIFNNKGVAGAAPTTPTKKNLGRSKSVATSAFSFNSDHVKAKTLLTSPAHTHNEKGSEAEGGMSDKKTSILVEIDKYLFGEKGHLLPFYTSTLVDWLEYCCKMGLPALTKVSCGLLNDCIVDPIMKEFESVVGELAGVSIQAYKLIDNKYLPYRTSRAPIPESSGFRDGGLFTHLNFTYSDLSEGHILTVRNRKLWHDSVGGDSSEQSKGPHTPQLSSMSKSNQKFQPAYAGLDGSLSLSSSHSMFSAEKQLLPRQQFLMLVVKNRELTLYSYNLADGKDDILKQHIILNAKKVTRWNNARFHLLNCIAHQKMGLFQHASIQDIPGEKHCEEKNPYTSSFEDTCQLAKSSRPTADSHKVLPSRPGSRFTKPQATTSPCTALDKVYRGCKPTRPMHLSKGGTERDPIARHGSQLIETYKNEQREIERRKKLDKLHNDWQERIGPIRTEIGEDLLDLLKQSSRLVHHVATPLLLSPQWRARAINLPRSVEELQKMDEENTVVGRSRNNSGTSMSSGLRVTADRMLPADSPVSLHSRLYEEEDWHVEMRKTFVSNYIDYLGQTQQPLGQLGFTTIKIRPTPRGLPVHHRKHSSGGSGSEQLVRSRTTDTLQKTVPGGIFLVELSFQEVYFVVKLYVFSASQLSLCSQSSHNSKNPISDFIGVCDRMRDNTHCHSFAHDFHLKVIHKYVKGSKDNFHYPAKEFHSGYHLVRMLRDFALFYEEAPRFSRNALALRMLQLESTNNPCDKLYDHILHDSQNRMTKITMVDEEADEEENCEYGLVFQQPKKYGEYELSVIVAHDHPPALRRMAVNDKLMLAYFVVLVNVNKEQQYPSDALNQPPSDNYLLDISNAGKLSSDSTMSSTSRRQIRMFSTRWTHGPCMAHSQERRMSENFAEFMNEKGEGERAQHPAYQLLDAQCNSVREKLTTLVEEASLQCRKQVLWDKMLNFSADHNKRSVSDVSNQVEDMEPLVYEEFEELLEHVNKQPASLQENLMTALQSLPMSWFIALTKLLSVKYQNSYREFVRKDNQVIHSVVLIPGVADAVILLTVNQESRKSTIALMLLEDTGALSDQTFSDAFKEFINMLCFHMWTQMGT